MVVDEGKREIMKVVMMRMVVIITLVGAVVEKDVVVVERRIVEDEGRDQGLDHVIGQGRVQVVIIVMIGIVGGMTLNHPVVVVLVVVIGNHPLLDETIVAVVDVIVIEIGVNELMNKLPTSTKRDYLRGKSRSNRSDNNQKESSHGTGSRDIKRSQSSPSPH